MASIPRAMPLRITSPRAARSRPRRSAICEPYRVGRLVPTMLQARHVPDLRIAAQIEEHRRIINLQQRLRIFRLGPVQEAAAGNVADACQLLFRTFEGVLIMDSLRYTRR